MSVVGPASGCGDDGAGTFDTCDEACTGTDDGGDGDGGDGDGDGDDDGVPLLVGEPEIVFHPNQPMVVDVIVELDRAGTVALSHDTDAGVKVASLAIEDDDRRHHLRARALAPDSDHDFTLTLTDAEDSSASATQPLSFTTNYQLPGFRPNFEVEVGDAAALDPGYRLFDYTYSALWDPAGIVMIDSQGVTRWYHSGGPTMFGGVTSIWAGVELLDDGSVLGVHDGAVTVIDELGEQRRRHSAFDYGLSAFHHEAHMLANGNILTLGNSFEEVDYSSLGLGLTLVAGDLLVEFDPEGEIVWTWDAFDHLDPMRMRSDPDQGLAYFDPETGEAGYDWTHGNGMVHTADDDVVLLSMRHQNWIVAIDHATGEVLWRLGEEGDFTLLEGSWFFHQHSPQWQPDGSLLLYDNAINNPDVPYLETESRAVRYALDFDAMTATQEWDSLHGEPVISPVAGDADRTPKGNVLVLDSALQLDPSVFDPGKNFSRLSEVSPGAEPSTIWSLTTKLGTFVYRATVTERLPGELAGG